jgi:dipeptide/tripeptide permease
MDVLVPTLLGCLIMGLPAILLAWIAFRRQRPIFFFAVALIVVGLGYLATTPTPQGLAQVVLGVRM